jgi:hypothetical protein
MQAVWAAQPFRWSSSSFRACSERPRHRRRAAEQQYELAPSHVGHQASSRPGGAGPLSPRSACPETAGKSLGQT